MRSAHHSSVRRAARRVAALVALALGAVGAAGIRPATAHAQMPPSGEQTLHPGDSVRVIVWRQPEFSGSFFVSADGTLEHPLLRHVVVGRVPIDTARARLGAALSQYMQNPEFVMEPFFRIIVSGEVRTPGTYSVPLDATLVQALAVAGGLAQDAKRSAVTLIRDGQTTVMDLSDPASPATRTLLLSGDQIIVPAQRDLLRDYIGPYAGIIAAAAALLNVLWKR